MSHEARILKLLDQVAALTAEVERLRLMFCFEHMPREGDDRQDVCVRCEARMDRATVAEAHRIVEEG